MLCTLVSVTDFYRNRVGRDKIRLGFFEKYVHEKCHELRSN